MHRDPHRENLVAYFFCLAIPIFKPGSQNKCIQAKVTDLGLLLLHLSAVFVKHAVMDGQEQNHFIAFFKFLRFLVRVSDEVRFINCSL